MSASLLQSLGLSATNSGTMPRALSKALLKSSS